MEIGYFLYANEEDENYKEEVKSLCVHCCGCARMFMTETWADFSNRFNNLIAALRTEAQVMHRPTSLVASWGFQVTLLAKFIPFYFLLSSQGRDCVQLWELKGWRGRRPLGGRWVLRSNYSATAHKARGKRETKQSPSSLGSWMLLAPLPSLAIKKESKFTYYNLFKQAASQAISILSFQIQGLVLRGLPRSIPDIWTHTGPPPQCPSWMVFSLVQDRSHSWFASTSLAMPLDFLCQTILLWLNFRCQGVCGPTSGPTEFSSANSPDAFWNSVALNRG